MIFFIIGNPVGNVAGQYGQRIDFFMVFDGTLAVSVSLLRFNEGGALGVPISRIAELRG